MDNHMDQEKIRKEEMAEKEEGKKRYQEKCKNYAKFVKEMHFPEVSEKKRQEMEAMKSLIKHKQEKRTHGGGSERRGREG